MKIVISFHEATGPFHLYNDFISYIFCILKDGQLGQIYFGKRIHDRESYAHLLEFAYRPHSSYKYENDKLFSLEHIKQEYPSFGHGDTRMPAYSISQSNGSCITEFVYKSHDIVKGKPGIPGLPAVYCESEDECSTLIVTLKDKLLNADLVLYYTIWKTEPVIIRRVHFFNCGCETFVIEKAASTCIDFPEHDMSMIELTGAWGRERYVKHRRLEHGVQGIYSNRGISSSNFNPFVALADCNADENQGRVYGFSLVYSGNFEATADVDTYGVTRVLMGISHDTFAWPLHPGEAFDTPECVCVFTDGFGEMSRVYHRLYRTRLARGPWRDKDRPVLVNSWEAVYFDLNAEKLLQLARTAASVGVELFVIDDGWFGSRRNDSLGLGDWFPSPEIFPDGLMPFVNEINRFGLKFGIWIEPEMVNKDSDLYRSHPEWILSVPGRSISHGRNQYVLDFSNPDVIDEMYSMLESVLASANIEYVKWDMNRSLSECHSCCWNAENQKGIYHRYMLGVYALYNRLLKRFPHILFESCASGGARFDPGMLYYAPQAWVSDETDAVERLKIQYGTSFVYPLSMMAAHVSAVPNHQVLRTTTLSTRGNVALFGQLGYELNLCRLSSEELSQIAEQIKTFKELRSIVRTGDFHRLLSPFDGNYTAWMVISEDKHTAVVGYYKTLNEVNVGYKRLRLRGLDGTLLYREKLSGTEQYGDELMNAGMIVSDRSSGEVIDRDDVSDGDFSSKIYIWDAVLDN